MKPSVVRPERKTDRQDTVLRELRSRIVRGEYAPGSRLPNRVDIEQQYAASSITVQRALEKLKEEGFITASRRNGTYVVPEPPHLTNIALVFPGHPGEPIWNRFWTSLCQVAQGLNEKQEQKIRIYYGVDGHGDSEDYLSLLRDVEHQQLAGIIFGNSPIELVNSPVIDEPNLPRVAVMTGTGEKFPAVYPVQVNLLEKAYEHLAKQGIKRVAIFQVVRDKTEVIDLAAKFGLEIRSYWRQPISLWEPITARAVTHLLMHGDSANVPQAIVVADDNLLPHVLSGLEDADKVLGKDVQVVSHCNLPRPIESPAEVVKVGFDSRQVMAACLESLALQRQGEEYPRRTTIQALFESEMAPLN